MKGRFIIIFTSILLLSCKNNAEINDTTPENTTPADTTPAVITPADTTPAFTSPADTTPAVTTPAVNTPAETTPAVTTPADTTPAATTPALTNSAATTPAVATPAATTASATTPAATTPKPFSCNDLTPENSCHCYYESSENSNIRCENVDNEKFSNLLKKFKEVKNITINYLLINKIQVKAINEGSFGNAIFKRIYIEENPQLEVIDKNAFVANDITEFLIIRNNPKLNESIFEVAKKFQNIRQLELDGNSIASIPSDALITFEKVEHIILKNQIGGLKSISAKAINNVPKLTQLLLENNQINKLENKSIDLSKAEKHIYVNFAHNNLTESSLSTDTIINKADINVTINLQYNQIKSVINNTLFIAFAQSLAGVISLENNTIECKCAEIKNQTWLKVNDQIHHLTGVIGTLCKSDNKTIGDCLGIK